MATMFMVDPEQPNNNANWPYNITTGKAKRLKAQANKTMQSQPAGTFHSLFGPPSPTLSKAEKARLNARKPSNRNIKRSKKPLPGTNTLLSVISFPTPSKPPDWRHPRTTRC